MFRPVLRSQGLVSVGRRNFSNYKSCSTNSASPNNGNVLEADSSSTLNKIYHSSALILAAVTPVALLAPTNPLTMPIDVAISVLIPLHSHVAMNYVVSDYVPRKFRFAARAAVLASTVIAAAGMLKLTFHGDGVTGTVKELWAKPQKK
eukprot:gene34171-41363_t